MPQKLQRQVFFQSCLFFSFRQLQEALFKSPRELKLSIHTAKDHDDNASVYALDPACSKRFVGDDGAGVNTGRVRLYAWFFRYRCRFMGRRHIGRAIGTVGAGIDIVRLRKVTKKNVKIRSSRFEFLIIGIRPAVNLLMNYLKLSRNTYAMLHGHFKGSEETQFIWHSLKNKIGIVEHIHHKKENNIGLLKVKEIRRNNPYAK